MDTEKDYWRAPTQRSKDYMKVPCQRFRGDEVIRKTIGHGLEINADGGLPETGLSERFDQPMEAAWKVLQATMEAAEERFFFLVRLHFGDSVLKAAFQTLL
jgi:hypothetical protein